MHDSRENPHNLYIPFVHISCGFHQRKIRPDFYTFVMCTRWRIRRSRNSIHNTNNSLNLIFRSVPTPTRKSFFFCFVCNFYPLFIVWYLHLQFSFIILPKKCLTKSLSKILHCCYIFFTPKCFTF